MCGGLFISFFVFFKQKTAYEMRISDWSSDVCSSDLLGELLHVVVDGVAVVVVGNQVDRLHFFAVCLGQHGCNCLGCCVSVVAKTEAVAARSEEHTSELQSLMRISYAVFCLKKKKTI